MQDLFAELIEQTDIQTSLLKELRKSGIAYAENESNYRMALSKAILEERAKGTPVSITSDICRGLPGISELRLARDSAEVIYKATQEALNVSKLRVRIINEQINREYS